MGVPGAQSGRWPPPHPPAARHRRRGCAHSKAHGWPLCLWRTTPPTPPPFPWMSSGHVLGTGQPEDVNALRPPLHACHNPVCLHLEGGLKKRLGYCIALKHPGLRPGLSLRGGGVSTPPPRVTFRRVLAPSRGPGQSPLLPFACCVGSLRSVGRCGRCSCWCRFRVRGAQSLVCWGCAECGGMCRLRVSGAHVVDRWFLYGGPGQSPGLPFACCVGSLRSVGRCGRCSCGCRFRVRGAQSLVCWGCAECGGMCRLRVSGAHVVDRWFLYGGPGQSPGLPFACCVGSLRSVGRCGRCSCGCRFRVRGAQSLVCWGCAECGGMCRLRVSGAHVVDRWFLYGGPGQSPGLPFACCVGSLRSVGRCGRCSCGCRFRVRGAQSLVCWGCAECGGMCRLRVSGAHVVDRWFLYGGPGQSPGLPFACCVGSLRSVGRCGRCSCRCRFRVRGAQSLVCRGCAERGGMCRLRVSGAHVVDRWFLYGGPGQSPGLPFACCVGSLRSVGRCGRCSCGCRFRVRGAQSLVCWGCAECGGMCRLRVSGAQ